MSLTINSDGEYEDQKSIAKNYDQVGQMMAWENGELSDEDTVELFQRLIDSREVWSLQGMYGRFAAQLIEEGYCTRKAI